MANARLMVEMMEAGLMVYTDRSIDRNTIFIEVSCKDLARFMSIREAVAILDEHCISAFVDGKYLVNVADFNGLRVEYTIY